MKVFLDYHATTPVDPRVLEAMLPLFCEEFGNPHSTDHAFGWRANAAIEQARAAVASFIGAVNDEILFTSGATEANNLAIIGAARALQGRRNRLLVSAVEHKCVLESAASLRQYGYTVEHVPVLPTDGRLYLRNLRQMLSEDVALVSVMAVNNEIGTVQPIEEIGALCREAGALFHSDMAQAPRAMHLDMSSLPVDMASFSAHKIYGPKGVGALYMASDLPVQLEPVIHGGGQEAGLRSGTLPTALCAGFGKACEILFSEGDEEREKLTRLSEKFLKKLNELVPEVQVIGTLECRHPGNLNLMFPDTDAHALIGALQPDIAVSTGSACTTGIPEPSHVLRAVGLTTEEAESCIRVGLGKDTTWKELEYALHRLVETYRAM